MKSHLPSLDLLRGVAIVLVLISHFFASDLPVWASLSCANGGVILFFLLSGYLMHEVYEPRTFALRRFFRIAPMYWACLALLVALEKWPLGTTAANAVFVAPAFHLPRMSGVFWTLYIEVLFYALVPLLLLARWGVAFAPVVWALSIVLPSKAPFYLAFCLLGFQIGAFRAKELRGWVVVVSAIVVCLASGRILPYLPVVSGACVLGLVGALRYRPSYPPLELAGRVSYSWYLLHPIIGYRIMQATGFAMPLSAFVGVAGSFLASWATFHAVERPCIVLGRYLGHRISP
jgi:peptidoglycan/LPS O-acetylase OafA/YrhL